MPGMPAWHAIPPWPGDKGKELHPIIQEPGGIRHNQPTQSMQTVVTRLPPALFSSEYHEDNSVAEPDRCHYR